jgi:hypothetical protein
MHGTGDVGVIGREASPGLNKSLLEALLSFGIPA